MQATASTDEGDGLVLEIRIPRIELDCRDTGEMMRSIEHLVDAHKKRLYRSQNAATER